MGADLTNLAHQKQKSAPRASEFLEINEFCCLPTAKNANFDRLHDAGGPNLVPVGKADNAGVQHSPNYGICIILASFLCLCRQ